MAEFYKVGYQLKYIDGKWNYIHGYGDTNNRNIQLCREKPYVGSWEGFWCSYSFENLIPDRGGLQNNFNEQMGIAFSAGGNYKPGIFVTETLYSGRSPDGIYVPYTEMLTTFSPDNRPYSGSVRMSVLQHLGNDNYRILVRIIIHSIGAYEKIYESKNIRTNTLNTVYIGGTYNQGGATCKIYNIQIADAWKINYENEIKLPKLNLCPIGKVNWTAVDFRDNIYSETVNCQIEQEKITINNNGYTASPAVPQLGAQHHVVYRVFFNSDPNALPFTINVGHFAENDTTMRMGVTLYGVRANDELFISQDPLYFNNVSFVGQTNVNGKIIEASGRVWSVSVRKTFDISPSLVGGVPYVYCTTIVCVYDTGHVYKKFEYKSREPYVDGQTIRFATRAINIENSVIVSTVGEQFVATSGFENQCIGNIIADFKSEFSNKNVVNFTDLSQAVNRIINYSWDFGDGETSTEKNPTHVFKKGGKKIVKLTVTGEDGVAEVTKIIKIQSGVTLSSFSGEGEKIFLPLPLLDNSTEINMAFKVHKTSDMTIRYFDNGQNYDSITSKAKYLLTKEEIDNFIDFFEDQTRGRGNVFRFELSQNSGYYPFGVDLGDTGTFFVKFKDAKWTTRLNKPWGMYELELSLHLVSPPDYEIPTITYKQGSFIIDDLVNLPNPEIQYDYENHLFTKTSLGGKLNNVDIGLSDYMHSSNLSFDVSVQNAGLLISKLKSIRINTFTITSPINCYPFGSKIGSGSFLVNLLDNTIKMSHNGHNNFRIEFQVGLQNVI